MKNSLKLLIFQGNLNSFRIIRQSSNYYSIIILKNFKII